MSELDMGFQYWSYWCLVAELLEFFTPFLTVDYFLALDWFLPKLLWQFSWLYMAIVFQSAIVHLWMQHAQKFVQMQFKWVHFSDAFLWLIFPIWYLWLHQLFAFPPDFTGWVIEILQSIRLRTSGLEAFLTMIFPQLQLFLAVCQLAGFRCISWVILSLYTI